jgi:hypothetical protein
MMKFRSVVEPPEPMRGLEVPPDTEPVTAAEPEDLAAALVADDVAGAAYDRLTVSQKRQHV